MCDPCLMLALDCQNPKYVHTSKTRLESAKTHPSLLIKDELFTSLSIQPTLLTWDDLEIAGKYNLILFSSSFVLKFWRRGNTQPFILSACVFPLNAHVRGSSFSSILRTGLSFWEGVMKPFENLMAPIIIPSPTSTITTCISKQIICNFSHPDNT